MGRLTRISAATGLSALACLALIGSANAGVCDPATLASNDVLCYGNGGLDNPANSTGASYSPNVPFVAGSEICFAYDITAEIEAGGYDPVFLHVEDNLGGSQNLCIVGDSPGDCTNTSAGGCLDFPSVLHELADTICWTPTTGATSVEAYIVVQPTDLEYQCADGCDAGGDLSVTVNSLSVAGCIGLGNTDTCGNGVINSGEECDDGNTLAQDGCSQACTREAGGICSSDGLSCAGTGSCDAVTPGNLDTSYCYSNTGGLPESPLSWSWDVTGGQDYLMYWDISGGVELFKLGEYDSLWLTWSDNAGGGETFFLNDGGLFQTAFYDTWSRASRRIAPNAGATNVTVTFWVQADGSTSCQEPKVGGGPSNELSVHALTLTSCDTSAQRFETFAEFTDAMGQCYVVHDFNDLASGDTGPFSGDGYTMDVHTNQPGIVLTAHSAPYHTTQASGDGSIALEAQGYGNYESNSRLRIDFAPHPRRAIGLNVIDAGDGLGIMAVEAYRDGQLVYVDNDIDASAPLNNYITWKGIIFSEPVDSVVFFMIEGGDFFNIDNVILSPQNDNDSDGVPNACDCAPNDSSVAGSFTEICNDGIDNDCDLLTDSGDPDCGGHQTSTCGEYADEALSNDNGGWLTSGNQSWAYVSGPGFWRAVGADGIDSSLFTAPFTITEGACDEVFKVAIDYGGNTESGYDFLTSSYAINGGTFVEFDIQSGNLAPKTYTLPNGVKPGDSINFRFDYGTDSATLGTDPTVSRIRIFSDADQDDDGVCDSCDCAPVDSAFGTDCDADDDGWCDEGVTQINTDDDVSGCPNEPGTSGSDCNDAVATANPGNAVETGLCNDGYDNDCDNLIDDQDPDCDVDDCTDNDSDGYGSGTTCAFGPDCDDTSALCTTDCSDTDDDNIPDCRDDCIDRDGDGFGIGDGCPDDCNDDVFNCTTDCTTDADANGVPDCEQDCIDGDNDGYGVGEGCDGSDCDDDSAQCTTDCSDDDGDGIADCNDDCFDVDGDGYGVGTGCLGDDCNDEVASCTVDCVTDTDGGDGNGTPDCEEVCEDNDSDGFGIGPACNGADCDDSEAACTVDCSDFDEDGIPDCADDDDDNDGLLDTAEAIHNTDPKDPDSDNDGLLDGQEVNNYNTDPNDRDTDGEGLDDGAEVKEHGTDPTKADTDQGGENDFSEIAGGRNPIDNPGDDFGGGPAGGQIQGNTGCASALGTSSSAPLMWIALLFGWLLWRRLGHKVSLRRVARAGLVGVAALAATTAVTPQSMAAGDQGFDLQNFSIRPGNDRIFSVDGSQVADHLTPFGGLWFHYVKSPLKVVVEFPGLAPQDKTLVESMMQLQVGAGLGLFGFSELEFGIPVNLSIKGDEAAFPGIGGVGVGDLDVRWRFELVTRDDNGNGFGLNAALGASIPVGASDGAAGDGGLTVVPEVSATLAGGPVLGALTVGTTLRTESGNFGNVTLGHELNYGLGLQIDLIDALAVGAEVFGSTPFSNFGNEFSSPLELAGGVKARIQPGLTIEAGAGTGIVGGAGAPKWRIFGGLQWAPFAGAEPDTDGDGILDATDACPTDPEDFDKFQDEDGCPELDNDKDGVVDTADSCPMDPEDIDGFQDDDGCPDADNDQDGLLDMNDQCPDQPEDKDGFKDDDGCPDPDNDGDGILDGDDQCMNEPENNNGYQDEDGCPDEAPLVRIENCKIVITEKIFFRTGRSTIRKVSYPLLNEVARIILDHDGIEKITIEGHTDSAGSARSNQRLSDARAKAVRKYLTRKGISSRKMKSKGYGEGTPIADNETSEGREQNRRVEFKVKSGKCQ